MSRNATVIRMDPATSKKFYTPVVEVSKKPAINMKFNSTELGYDFYSAYAKLAGFEVRWHTKRSRKCGVNEVVTLRYIVCSKQGFQTFQPVDTLNNASESLKKMKDKRRRASKRTGCLAEIHLRLIKGNIYELYDFVEEHNHDFVDEEDYQFLNASRNLTFTQQQTLADLSEMNIGPVKAFNLMRKMHGGFEKVGATATDCKNFKRDLNLFLGEFDVEMAVQRLQKKKEFLPEFSCNYFCDDKGALGGLFWADEEMKNNYEVFGDVISFDATFRTNRYGLVFVPFTGIDNHHHNITFGAALLASECTETYKWLLLSFLSAFGVAPKVVVTDQDPAMKIAIEQAFPDTRHRLCMWHIMTKVAEKVGTTLSHDETFKEDICNVVWTDALEPEDFVEQWGHVMDKYNLKDHKWLTDMYNVRSDWIPAYYRNEHMSGLMRTTSRSESENHFFGQLTNTKLSLVEFLSHFDTAIESQRYKHRKNDHETRYTVPKLQTDYELECQALDIYTREIFYDVQEEIRIACKNIINRSDNKVGDVITFNVMQVNLPGMYKVLFNVKEIDVKCSCNRYEQYGLLCRHIFFILRMMGIKVFPKKYIMKRWTRDAVPKKSSAPVYISKTSGNSIEQVSSIVNEIMNTTEYIVNRLVSNMDELSLYRDKVNETKLKLDSSFVSSEPIEKNARLANILGVDQPAASSSSAPSILPPNGIRNKGSGSNKRYKSFREVTSSKVSKKSRQCKVCGSYGHNSRTCIKKTRTCTKKTPIVRAPAGGAIEVDVSDASDSEKSYSNEDFSQHSDDFDNMCAASSPIGSRRGCFAVPSRVTRASSKKKSEI